MASPAPAASAARPGSFWDHHFGLGTRLALAVAILLAGLLAVLVASNRRDVEERRRAEVENAVDLAQTAAAVLDGFFRDLESTTLVAAVAIGAQPHPFDQPTNGPLLDAVTRNYGILRTVFITDPAGQVVASAAAQGVGADVSARPYIRALQGGVPTTWSGSLTGIESGQVTVAFARAIPGPDGSARGFLVAAFYPERLLERLTLRLPADARITYIDETGQLLFVSDRSAASIARRDVSADPAVQRALRGELVRFVDAPSLVDQEPRFGAYATLARPGWVVGFSRPREPLEAALRARFVQEAGAVTALVLLAAVATAVIARGLVRPLSQLAGSADAIARGERPAVPAMRAADPEVRQLARAMQVMAAAVAEREASLADLLTRERAAHAAAEAALRLREEFLSIAAHELKTPVTALRGYAQLVLRRLDRQGTVAADFLRKSLTSIDGQADRLARLINQLLDVSRIEAGRLALERAPTDIAALTRSAVDTVRATVASRRQIVVYAPHAPVLVPVDPLRLEQVLTNLLTNAVKFSGESSPVDVTVTASAPIAPQGVPTEAGPNNGAGWGPQPAPEGTPHVRLAVRDYGPGVAPEHRAHIFDRFYQAHGDGHLGGMGLGLYISRQIVELHGGQLAAEFLEDGTIFTVTLPASDTHPLPNSPDASAVVSKDGKRASTEAGEVWADRSGRY